MIHYLLINDAGRVCRRGGCPTEADVPVIPGLTKVIIDESDGRRPDTAIPTTATIMRSMAYPSVGDQLGAIWKAIAPLIEHPEAETIMAKIQAVKDANPKP